MTPEEKAALIVGIILLIGLILIAVISIVVAILVTTDNAKHNKYVKNNSELLKSVKDINSKYKFEALVKEYQLKQRFDNKGYWYKTEPVAVLTREIRDNLIGWKEIKRKVDYNKVQFVSYKKELSSLNTSFTEEICKANKVRYNKCLRIEDKLYTNEIKIPVTDIRVFVSLRYVSPKGQVDITKSQDFGYVEIMRIIDSVSTRRVDRKTYQRLASAERGVLTDSMRYDVMKRDGFRCVLCGMSSKDGAILHVDHIIPVSKGGKTVMSNLRTLCERCNLGKSNKIE